MAHDLIPDGYDDLLTEIKIRIQQTQTRAALSVNRELLMLYWRIGRDILTRQHTRGWGAKIIDRLAHDLRQTFPDMKGFSPRNLKYMRAFADAYPDEEFVQQVAAQIPWFHQCVVLDKIKDTGEREWYIRQAAEHGWSRNVLVHQIESGLFHRQGHAVTNFDRALPSPQSDLARQMTGVFHSAPPPHHCAGERDFHTLSQMFSTLYARYPPGFPQGTATKAGG